MNITVIDEMFFHPEHLKKLQTLGTVTLNSERPKNETEALARVKDADVIINFWYPMSSDLIKQLPKTKMICVAAAGYDFIDVQAAKNKKITVCNCPRHNGEAVAEYTIGLLLQTSRLASEAERTIRNGSWNPEKFKGKELKNKTLGIIGYGYIGKRVGEIAKNGLGMNVISISSSNNRDDLEHLLKNSDVLSINAPLTETTKNMISDAEFGLMKAGVVIVNTGRGAIINQEALVKNITSGKIFSVGLDVYPVEPMEKDNPLLKFSNVVLTPHIGWNTEESEFRLSEMVVENIKAYLTGNPQNVVT